MRAHVWRNMLGQKECSGNVALLPDKKNLRYSIVVQNIRIFLYSLIIPDKIFTLMIADYLT